MKATERVIHKQKSPTMAKGNRRAVLSVLPKVFWRFSKRCRVMNIFRFEKGLFSAANIQKIMINFVYL